MKNTDVYLYGMTLATTSFLLDGGFLRPDEYSEISKKYRLPGGETGSCATVLASLGVSSAIDGNHIGTNVAPVLREFYKDKPVDLSLLYMDENYDGLEDFVVIADDIRSPMGMFGHYYTDKIKRWNKPSEDAARSCKVAAIDPFFGDESTLAAEFCVRHGKAYVTIDCRHDSFLHKHAAVTVISGEGIENNNYKGMSREEIYRLFADNTDGLTIITNGSRPLLYGRKGEDAKYLAPYKTNVVSTLGAGDTFKAGCVYALLNSMDDDATVRFASACSAVAVSRFPLPLNPPRLDEINAVMRNA